MVGCQRKMEGNDTHRQMAVGQTAFMASAVDSTWYVNTEMLDFKGNPRKMVSVHIFDP
jgi:hypothetical protein